MSFRLSLVIVVGVAGCGFSAGYDGTHYRCGADDRCPDGYMCVADYCELNPASGDGSVIDADPNAPDAAPSLAACGALEILHDDFTDGTVGGWPWDPWNDPGVSIAESGGDLSITMAAGSGDVYGGYGSRATYDLTESQIQVEVDEVGGQNTILEVRGLANQKIQMVDESGMLFAAEFNDANEGDHASVPLDLAVQKYWRVREHAGRIYWEYSANRQSWTHLYDEPDPFPMTDVYGYVSAGGQLASESSARFSDVNGEGSSLAYCDADSLHDSFTAGQFEPNWEWWDDTGCSITETGGKLVMNYDGAETNCFTGIQTYHRYDLTSSSFVVDASQIPVLAHFITYVAATDPTIPNDDGHLEIGLDFGDGTGTAHLYVEEQIDAQGTDAGYEEVAYDATQMRYWRLRGAGGHFYIDTSPDNGTWTNRLDAPAQIDLSAAQLNLGAGNYDLTSATTVQFGGVDP